MSSLDTTEQITGLPLGLPSATYTLSAQQAFTLVGVRALFDGTGAAGAFLPCVKIVSDSGAVMAQTVGTSVAAGSSADVTFAPFLEAPAAASGGITTLTSTDSSITITNPTGPTANLIVLDPTTGTEIIADSSEPLTAGSSYTFGWAHASGPTIVNLGTSQRAKVTTAGWYAFRVRVNSGDSMADGDVLRLFLNFYTAAVAAIDSMVNILTAPTALFPDFFCQGVTYLPVNGFATADVQNDSGVTNYTVNASMAINWLSR